MGRKLGYRLAVFAAALTLGMAYTTIAAPAALEMSTGLRHVVASGPFSECETNSKTALNASLTNAGETAEGSGQWLAYGPFDAEGRASAAAAIHCYPVGNGYVVTFTCATDVPPSTFSASDLCNRLYASFTGKAVTPLATPTPVPTGCALTNLVGTWNWDDNPGKTFTFDADGGLVGSDGVSGSWALSGSTVTMTYYGSQTLTLSADGKKLAAPRGVPRNFTRKC
jgi:hypothetical protein